MSNPALLSWLIIGHFVGDFLFQTNWMAFGKTQRFLPRWLIIKRCLTLLTYSK